MHVTFTTINRLFIFGGQFRNTPLWWKRQSTAYSCPSLPAWLLLTCASLRFQVREEESMENNNSEWRATESGYPRPSVGRSVGLSVCGRVVKRCHSDLRHARIRNRWRSNERTIRRRRRRRRLLLGRSAYVVAVAASPTHLFIHDDVRRKSTTRTHPPEDARARAHRAYFCSGTRDETDRNSVAATIRHRERIRE